jgi:hypothetical protein
MMELTDTRVAIVYYLRAFRRQQAFIALALVLPLVFIQTTFLVSPRTEIPMRTVVAGFHVTRLFRMPHIHGTVMAPITGAFVAGMTGVMLVRSGLAADKRLARAGITPTAIVCARLVLVFTTALFVSAVSVTILFANVSYANPGWVFLGVVLAAGTYGFLGMLAGQVLDRTSGLYVMLFGPMLDIGVFQDPIFFSGDPEWWMRLLPGHFSMQLLLDAGFTDSMAGPTNAILATAYFLAVTGAAILVYGTRLAHEEGLVPEL